MVRESRQIIMIGAENGALKNGKVGGLADVIRDLPNALGRAGWSVTVITPSYGFLHTVNPSKPVCTVTFPFAGTDHRGLFLEVQAMKPQENVRHLVFEHPQIRGNPIYSADLPDQPFASDATKYALFCSAVGQFVLSCDDASVIHLHDWHTATLFLLRERHPSFSRLKNYRIVFTIHNLSYQGSRPLRGKHATVEEWFPELFTDTAWMDKWADERYKAPTFTPMAAGITHADMLNTVSHSYAEEILLPSDPKTGFHGGEGLEKLLQEAKRERRLTGILNGIEYPGDRIDHRVPFSKLFDIIHAEVLAWNETLAPPPPESIIERILHMRSRSAGLLLTSVTRVSEQKIRLLFERGSAGKTAIDMILDILNRYNGFFILIGNGDPKYERLLEQCAAVNNRFLYLKLYSDIIAQALYANGTLFLMPSSFEPCGITQMIAMRDGQPCIVHATGGLKDTVIDGVNGFQFKGGTIKEQVDDLLAATKRALKVYSSDKDQWQKICTEARRVRFDWEASARRYIKEVYSPL